MNRSVTKFRVKRPRANSPSTLLSRSLSLARREVVVMSDREKGLVGVVNETVPNCYPRLLRSARHQELHEVQGQSRATHLAGGFNTQQETL